MSMSVNTMTLTTTIAVHDKDDLATLGSFLVALANTDLDKLGIKGGGKIEYRKRDYVAIFDGGNIVRRATRRGTHCFREFKCPISECDQRVLNNESSPRFCTEHRAEMHGESKNSAA